MPSKQQQTYADRLSAQGKRIFIKIFETAIWSCYMFLFRYFVIYFSRETGRRVITEAKIRNDAFPIISGWDVYTWSIVVTDVCVTRVGSCTSCVRSNRFIRFFHLLLPAIFKSMFKSPIVRNSWPVVYAIEISSSNKSIHHWEHLVVYKQFIPRMVWHVAVPFQPILFRFQKLHIQFFKHIYI